MATKPTSPNPTAVFEARARIDEGRVLPENFEGVRPYFCRNCGLEVRSDCIPRGWYLISRARGHFQRHQRLGLFCSAACISGQVPRLEGIQTTLGDRWDKVPSPYSE
jgi:hypothetical protein